MRRYFAVVVTVGLIRGVAWFRDGWKFTSDSLSKSLIQEGFLWQLNLLSAKSASVFTDFVMDISAILSGVGAALLLISLSNVITIEQLPRCSPIGDTSALINRDYDEVRDWITQNDELIEALMKDERL